VLQVRRVIATDGRSRAYLNGQIVPESQATVSIFDRGYMNGVGVFERTRTQRGVMFRLDQHLARLKASLTMTRLNLGMSIEQLKKLTEDVLARNLPLLGSDSPEAAALAKSAVSPSKHSGPRRARTTVRALSKRCRSTHLSTPKHKLRIVDECSVHARGGEPGDA